jgi:hypothetical protein
VFVLLPHSDGFLARRSTLINAIAVAAKKICFHDQLSSPHHSDTSEVLCRGKELMAQEDDAAAEAK